MQKKSVPNKILQHPRPTNWMDYIQDDRLRLAIPIGPRFQAQIPEWTTQHDDKNLKNSELDTLKCLGTQIWPLKGGHQATKKESIERNTHMIGKGRPDFCSCEFPGSIKCIKTHVEDKRVKLQFELGPAFWRWKFNEMGEDVSKLWTLEEQEKFEAIVKMNPISQGRSFLGPALEALPSQSKQSIVNYFLNVYLPRQISMQTRFGCRVVDTDDEVPKEAPKLRGSTKRCQVDILTSLNSKLLKTRYLTGKR